MRHDYVIILLIFYSSSTAFIANRPYHYSSQTSSLNGMEARNQPIKALFGSKSEAENIARVPKKPCNQVYIRAAEAKDLKRVADILTYSFFLSGNILSWPLEWLKTYLSLEDGFANLSSEYIMYVALSENDIVGFCELDSRDKVSLTDAPRPYMCNLAIDEKSRRKGIAKALIHECEKKVIELKMNYLHIRVRETNLAAIALYNDLKYEQVNDNKPKVYKNFQKEEILLLRKRCTEICTSEN